MIAVIDRAGPTTDHSLWAQPGACGPLLTMAAMGRALSMRADVRTARPAETCSSCGRQADAAVDTDYGTRACCAEGAR